MPASKTDAEWTREALERIAGKGGLPKLADLAELRRLCNEIGNVFDEYTIDAHTVAHALYQQDEILVTRTLEESDKIPFEVTVEDVAVLALAVEEARNLASELTGFADGISKHIADVDMARRFQAGELG